MEPQLEIDFIYIYIHRCQLGPAPAWIPVVKRSQFAFKSNSGTQPLWDWVPGTGRCAVGTLNNHFLDKQYCNLLQSKQSS